MGNTKYDSCSERDLWNLVRTGDEGAFSFIYREQVKYLFTYGSHFTNDEELVKDCIQEVFARLFHRADKLGETTNIRFYLCLALRNEIWMEYRRRKRLPLSAMDELPFLANFYLESPEEEPLQQHLEKIVETINLLPHRQKEIIYYRYIEELSYEQICRIMGLKYQSAVNLVQRSLKKIREIYTHTFSYSDLPLALFFILKMHLFVNK
ncbi:RNA polymerase sigma factor, sigma-70 family [Porphyromonadaceae bacterium KHP3R9]|jgi:RNA polymerase sigma factor (sigma-70 family)|nr:RNA polymerase sigma factor, sigma-70 family [Porphyromonadaceae bacterium KHP3R9]